MADPTPEEIRAELQRLKAFWDERGWNEEATRRYQRLQRALAAMEQDGA